MIIRIVRMTFEPGLTEEFLKVFNENKNNIRNFPGCSHLELHRDVDKQHVFATYSYWEKKEDLENYRRSELFEKVWGQTKALFAGKPEAFSHERMMIVEPGDDMRI